MHGCCPRQKTDVAKSIKCSFILALLFRFKEVLPDMYDDLKDFLSEALGEELANRDVSNEYSLSNLSRYIIYKVYFTDLFVVYPLFSSITTRFI